MTVTITSVSTPPAATLVIPADGESVDSASVALYVQTLANSVEYLRLRTRGNADQQRFRVPLDIGNSYGGVWMKVNPLGGTIGEGRPGWACGSNTSGILTFMITHLLPPWGIIQGASCLFDGGAGHGALPANKPSLSLVKWATDFGNPTSYTTPGTIIQTKVDTATSVPAYEAVHSILLDPVAETINTDSWDYGLQVVSESGANALTGGFLSALFFKLSPA